MEPQVLQAFAGLIMAIKACEQGGYIKWLPLISALIAAITAIMATRASVHFANATARKNFSNAVKTEISIIVANLQAVVEAEQGQKFLLVDFLASPDRICPVFKNSGNISGSLNSKTSEKVIIFYLELLTSSQVIENGKHQTNKFLANNIKELIAKGKQALAVL